MTGMSGFTAIRRTLGHRNFGIYVAGNAISLIGTWVQRIAIGWLTWELTESGAWLGLVAFADLFPAVLIGPIGGVFADRFPRIAVIRVAQFLLMLQSIMLFALTASGLITVWSVLALALFNGIVFGFNQPARLALVPSLVPRDDLPTAVAINAIIFNLARFIGPAIAGALIVAWGTAPAFGINAISYFAFLFALMRLSGVDELEAKPPRDGGASVFGEFVDGLSYAARHPGIGILLLLMAIMSVAVRPMVELMAGFAADVFAGGADTFAMLSATLGLGAIAGGFWLANRGSQNGLAVIVLVSMAVASFATFGFVAGNSLWLALPCVAIFGFAMVSTGVSTQTLVQIAVDGNMRGRVLSLYGLIFRGGPALGALVMGAASEFVGLRWPLAIGAAIALGFMVWAWGRRQTVANALETPEAAT